MAEGMKARAIAISKFGEIKPDSNESHILNGYYNDISILKGAYRGVGHSIEHLEVLINAPELVARLEYGGLGKLRALRLLKEAEYTWKDRAGSVSDCVDHANALLNYNVGLHGAFRAAEAKQTASVIIWIASVSLVLGLLNVVSSLRSSKFISFPDVGGLRFGREAWGYVCVAIALGIVVLVAWCWRDSALQRRCHRACRRFWVWSTKRRLFKRTVDGSLPLDAVQAIPRPSLAHPNRVSRGGQTGIPSARRETDTLHRTSSLGRHRADVGEDVPAPEPQWMTRASGISSSHSSSNSLERRRRRGPISDLCAA